MVSIFSPVQEQINFFFPPPTHPYRRLEREVEQAITPESNVLEIGCGRTAPDLVKLKGKANTLTGIEVVDFRVTDDELNLVEGNICNNTSLESDYFDVAYSKSVMEHVERPLDAFKEINRVLRKNGKYIFLTPSIYDYGSIVAWMVPNKFHPAIVKYVEGRNPEDVFPTCFGSNSKKTIYKLAEKSGLKVVYFQYIGQYPAYLMGTSKNW